MRWHKATFGKRIRWDLLDVTFAPGGCFAVDATSISRTLSSERHRHRLGAIQDALSTSTSPLEGFMLERSWPEVFGVRASQVRAVGCIQASDIVSNQTKTACTEGTMGVGRPFSSAQQGQKVLQTLKNCSR